MLFGLQRRHMGSTIFGILGLTNSIRALTLWLLRCGGEEQELIV
jgi:hypothetical protein